MDEVVLQRSFIRENGGQKQARTGTLFLVGTPIGNLEDMTYRAVSTLKEVHWIAAEDTRQTKKLLNHFDISARLLSYHEHNKEKSGQAIIERLMQGDDVALVSDAGLPAISDPGADLVEEAVRFGIPVVPIPGPNAALSALIASGLPTDRFSFLGFLPREQKKAKAVLEQWKAHHATMILYEAPHRVAATLKLMFEIWGNRRLTMARELTKRYEEFARGTVATCISHLEANPPLGEYCLIVGGSEPSEQEAEGEAWWEGLTVSEHVTHYEAAKGLSRKDAIKQTAADRSMPKRDIYNEVMRKNE